VVVVVPFEIARAHQPKQRIMDYLHQPDQTDHCPCSSELNQHDDSCHFWRIGTREVQSERKPIFLVVDKGPSTMDRARSGHSEQTSTRLSLGRLLVTMFPIPVCP